MRYHEMRLNIHIKSSSSIAMMLWGQFLHWNLGVQPQAPVTNCFIQVFNLSVNKYQTTLREEARTFYQIRGALFTEISY